MLSIFLRQTFLPTQIIPIKPNHTELKDSHFNRLKYSWVAQGKHGEERVRREKPGDQMFILWGTV